MATLDPPLKSLSLSQHDLQISLLGWHKVGSCTITTNDDFHFSASGSYNAMGHSGSFNIALELTDHNPAASTGPCKVTNAGQTVTGTYTRTGQSISFSDGHHSVTVSPDGKNVVLQVSGYPKARILG